MDPEALCTMKYDDNNTGRNINTVGFLQEMVVQYLTNSTNLQEKCLCLQTVLVLPPYSNLYNFIFLSVKGNHCECSVQNINLSPKSEMVISVPGSGLKSLIRPLRVSIQKKKPLLRMMIILLIY